MKKILYIIPIVFAASLGVISSASANTINAYTINGYRTCTTNASIGLFTAAGGLSVGEVSENAGIYGGGSSPATAYLETSSSVILATTTAAFPVGSSATTSMTFTPFQNLVNGQVYRLCYQPNVGDVVSGDTGSTGYLAPLHFSGASAVSATLLYPQNSTSTFIHDFSDFTFVATNTDSVAHIARFQIVFDTTSTLDADPITISRNVNYSFAAGSTHYLNIPKTQILASSTQYYAELCTAMDGGPYACGSVITFQLGTTKYGQQINTSQAGFFGASSSEPALLYNSLPQVENTSQYCDVQFYDPSSWACWGWLQIQKGIDQLGNYAGAGIERIASTTEDIFPLQVFFALNADFQNLQTTTTDIQVKFVGQGNAYKKVGGGYYTFQLLSSSTASASETATGFDWETFLATLIYALDGVAIVGTAFALLHKTSQHKK